MRKIDLNCDAGENYGPWQMGDDASMFALVSSVNIACGGHAGDYASMSAALKLAKKHGVAIGAHPSFEDKEAFGRRCLPLSVIEIERMVAYQVGGLAAIAATLGLKLNHVKAHGALANLGAKEKAVADAIARATKAVDKSYRLLAISGTQLQDAGERAGLHTIAEGFADRAYDAQGQLVSRSIEGAVIHDTQVAAKRCLKMAQGLGVITQGGHQIPLHVESICVHGDTPGAVHIASACRQLLLEDGFTIIAPN